MNKNIIAIILMMLGFGSCTSNKELINSTQRTDLKTKVVKYSLGYKPLSNFDKDTSAYLEENFIKRKNFYIGKELSVLLNDLELNIKDYYPTADVKNIGLSPALGINFFTEDEHKQRKKFHNNPLRLIFYWETSLPEEDITFLGRRSLGRWTNDHRNYFGQFKIKQISMSYPYQKPPLKHK